MENSAPPLFIERDYPVLLNQIGPDKALRPHVVFDYMQDIAAQHADLLKVGMSYLKELGIIWILSRIRLHMDRYPESGDTVHVRTWPSGIRKLFAQRQYELFSALSGERLGYGSSCWLTLDLKTLRPLNPAQAAGGRIPENADRPVFFPDLGKLPAVQLDETAVTHTAEQSHIDYNNHMNNAFYAMFTQDFLARKAGGLIRFKEIQINFNHSVAFGGSFRCGGVLNDDHSFGVCGMLDDGTNVFSAAGSLM